MSFPLPPRPALRLSVTSLVGPVTRLFFWGIRRPDGSLQTGGQRVTLGTAFGVMESVDVPVADGVLEWASIRMLADGRPAGEAWAQLSVVYEGAPFPLATIPVCQGWAGFTDGPNYPTGPQMSEPDGGSPPFWLPFEAVAPGSPQQVTLVGIEATEVMACNFLFTADATVIARRPRVEFVFPSTLIADWICITDITASQVSRVLFSASMGCTASLAFAKTGSGGRMALPPDTVVFLTATNQQAGDTITLGQMLMRWRPAGF